jgi:uncharacterized membrane protein
VLRRATPERLSFFSDGVFAVLITVLVLELRPPESPTFAALMALWPSYAVSYLFIAIVWTNHHYLMRYASEATPRLQWFNFAHLFSMSLLPFSTAWMAVSKLAPQPVAFYAAVFFLVNATYVALIWELIDRTPGTTIAPKARRIMRMRSLTTLCGFAVAAVVALKYPVAGLGIWVDEGGVLDKAAFESEDLDFTGAVGFMIHGINGMMIIPLLGLALLVVSFFARLPGGVKVAAIVLGAIVVQVLLGLFGHESAYIGALHGLNAFILFGSAVYAARLARTAGVDTPTTAVAA